MEWSVSLRIGELLKSDGIQKIIYLPESEEVLKYLERMDFFKFAGSISGLSRPYHKSQGNI